MPFLPLNIDELDEWKDVSSIPYFSWCGGSYVKSKKTCYLSRRPAREKTNNKNKAIKL